MEVTPHKDDHDIGNAKDVVLSITEDTVEESQATSASMNPTISKCMWATQRVRVVKFGRSLKSEMDVVEGNG